MSLLGKGIFKGMAVTLKNFALSYVDGGKKERLPSKQVQEINTMCGHGMVSFNFVAKIIDYIRLGILTPEQGAAYLARPCTCGAFNPSRATELLEETRSSS